MIEVKMRTARAAMLVGYGCATALVVVMCVFPFRHSVPVAVSWAVRTFDVLIVLWLARRGYLASVSYYYLKEMLKNEDHTDV